MNKKIMFPGFLIALMVIGVFSVFGPALAGHDHQVFAGAQYINRYEYALSNQLQYGFHVSLFSTLEIPSDWYLQYTFGVYLMNSSGTGYYIGLHQYHGVAQIYINPVISGVAFGLDGQPSNFYNGVPSHLGLVYNVPSIFLNTVMVDYNDTTGDFSITQNYNVLVSNNYSGHNFVFYKYAVENPLGRTGIAGTVAYSSYGPDNSDHTYTVTQSSGIDFLIYTDGVNNSAGGSLVWNSTDQFFATTSGGPGFATDITTAATVRVTAASSASNYLFQGFNIVTDYTGEYYPPGLYDFAGRLISTIDRTHIYATESGYLNSEIGNGVVNLLPFSVQNGDASTSEFWWHNSTGAYQLVRIQGAYYDIQNVWLGWWSGISIMPQSAGILQGNPVSFQYLGSNITVIASFTSINNNPNSAGTGPTPTPTIGTGGLNLTFGTFNGGIYMIVVMVIGAFATLAGVVILMKAPGVWVVGIIAIVVGFFASIFAQPNLLGPFAFSVELISFSIMLYGNRTTTTQGRK